MPTTKIFVPIVGTALVMMLPLSNLSHASHEGGAAGNCPAATKARLEQARVEDIYSGRAGAPGDLIQVTIQDGTLSFRKLFKKQRTAYKPLTFLIAIGERKSVRFNSWTTNMRRTVRVAYTYKGFQFDSGYDAKLFAYKKTWDRGLAYPNITLGKKSNSRARGITLTIRVIRPSRETYLYYKENAERRYISAVSAAQRSCAAAVRASIINERERARLEVIYRGDVGVEGDLIRVSVQGGTMEFRNKRWGYQPTSFLIATGERKVVKFISSNGRRTIHANMSYTNGNLRFDSGRGAKNFIFEPGWHWGRVYRNVTLNKHTATDAQNITLMIKILYPRRHRNRYRYIIVIPGGHDHGRSHYRGYRRRYGPRDDHSHDYGSSGRPRTYIKKGSAGNQKKHDSSDDKEYKAKKNHDSHDKHKEDDDKHKEKPGHGKSQHDEHDDDEDHRHRDD